MLYQIYTVALATTTSMLAKELPMSLTWNWFQVRLDATKQYSLPIQRLQWQRLFRNLVRLKKIGNAATTPSITITKGWLPQVVPHTSSLSGHLSSLQMMHATQWLIMHGLESVANSLELQLRYPRNNAVLLPLQRYQDHLRGLALFTLDTNLHSKHAQALHNSAGTPILMRVNQSILIPNMYIVCCLVVVVLVHPRRP